jgi:hypothetical protein
LSVQGGFAGSVQLGVPDPCSQAVGRLASQCKPGWRRRRRRCNPCSQGQSLARRCNVRPRDGLFSHVGAAGRRQPPPSRRPKRHVAKAGRAPTNQSRLAPTPRSVVAPTIEAGLHRPGEAVLHRRGAASLHRQSTVGLHRHCEASLHRQGEASLEAKPPSRRSLLATVSYVSRASTRSTNVRAAPRYASGVRWRSISSLVR